MKNILYSAVSFSAMLLAYPAFAQDEPTASPNDEATGIAEIVVTAQRRSQNVQDVPIAIAAVDAVGLKEAGIRDPRDLTLLVPSLSMQSGTAATTTSLFIRGVGIGDFNSNTTGAVGVYVDDVFLGANAGKLFNLFDSEGIEVLKGPQGTLYGRNTTAGAIRFSSRKPTNDFSADASALYGRFNELMLEGGIGGPIVADRLKVRVSGLYNRRDGTTFNRVTGNRVNDVDLWAARAIVDVTPSDDVLLRLSIHGGANRGSARQFQHRGQGFDFFGNPAVLPDGTPLDGLGYADTDGNIYAGDYDLEGQERVDVFGASLTSEFKLGDVTLTTISAYEKVNRQTLEDSDASPNDILTALYVDRPRQFSQEVRLQSDSGGNLTWIIGGYYFHDKLTTDSSFDILRALRDPTAPLNGFDPANSIGVLRYPYIQKTDSLAAFGQADLKLSENLTATLGLRYSSDKIDFDYSSFFDENGFIVPIIETEQTKRFNDLSWRLALTYQGKDVLVYASASKGYNSGGFAGGASTDPLQVQPFKSEKLYAYEVGFKSDLLDRKLRFNASAFYYNYLDLQAFVFDTSGIVPVQRKLNAGNASILGLEAELTAKPIDALELFVATTLLDSKYKNFIGLAGTNFDGNRLVNAPSLALSAGATLTVPVGDKGSVRAHAALAYTSAIFLYPDNLASNRVAGHTVVNARLAWKPASDRYELALWGKNLTGEEYITGIFPVITMDQLNYNEPRTFGVQLSVHF